MLKKGDRIPTELRFTTSCGETQSLQDLTEHEIVVFYFYPKDFTPGCTKEACYFRDHFGEIREMGGQVFGISLDGSDSHEAFREKYQLPFALIPDENKELSRLFGVLLLGGLLKTRRATFLIDPRTGEVVDAFNNGLNMTIHADRVIAYLKDKQGASS